MYAQPVPVGGVDIQEQSEDGSTEEEDAAEDPNNLVPQGHGRFALRGLGLPRRQRQCSNREIRTLWLKAYRLKALRNNLLS